MRPMIACLLVAVFATVGFADGFTWNSAGYWVKGSTAYVPVKQSYNSYGGAKWSYKQVALQQADKYTSQEWRDVLAKYAARYRGQQLEHQQYIEALRELGLSGSYPQVYQQRQQQQNGLGYPFVEEQGNTQYGYSQQTYRSLVDVFGSVDLGEVYNMAGRLRQDSQMYEAQGHDKFLDVVGGLSNAAASVAEIQARAQLLDSTAQVLAQTNAQAKVTVREDRTTTGRDQRGNGPAPPSHGSVIKQVCASCHGVQLTAPDGGVFIDEGVQLDDDMFIAAVRLVLRGKMPPDKHSITPQQRAAVLQELDMLARP